MRKYELNVIDSEKLCTRNKNLVEIKMCYSNVANIVLNYFPLFREYKGIKIAYGGVNLAPALDGAYAKHCFFLYEDSVIDPTAMLWDKELQNRDYVVARTFSYDEYMKEVMLSDGDTSLDRAMRKDYQKLMECLRKENKILVG